jgi:glycine/D-amino acid oxidase-like deaminating enzyme
MVRVIVAGGGIFGVTGALELAARGHAVTLLDPGPIPRPEAASTDISKLVRMDYGHDALYAELMEHAFLGWEAWNQRFGAPLYHQVGLLAISKHPMAEGGFEEESHRLLSSRGHTLERFDRARFEARFPEWRWSNYQDGYWNPKAGWAESGRVVACLADEARKAGVAIREGVALAGLLEAENRVTGVRTQSGESISADRVLLAGGAWTPVLLPELSDRIQPVGQPVLHFRPDDPGRFRPPAFPPWCADIATTGWYGFPANADGIVKVANHGKGRPIHPDAPRAIDPSDEPRFRAFLAETFPRLAEAPLVGSRLCLYSDSFDGDFWIATHPGRRGLSIASGGSGHGFKFAPVLGGLIADALEEKANPFLDRFRWRERGARKTEGARFLGS